MIRYLSVAEVHAIASAITKAKHIVRDEGLLASAVIRPQHTFSGEDLYTGVWAKAAVLTEGIARNHALVDGNKRTAWMSGRAFLAVNGVNPHGVIDTDTAEEFMVSIARGEYAGDIDRISYDMKNNLYC